jgi:hypothetical protein
MYYCIVYGIVIDRIDFPDKDNPFLSNGWQEQTLTLD